LAPQLNASNNAALPQFFDNSGNLLPQVMDICKAYYVPTLNVSAKTAPIVSNNLTNSEAGQGAAGGAQNTEAAQKNSEAAQPQNNTEAAQKNSEAAQKNAAAAQ
jgi:hypothetical protein